MKVKAIHLAALFGSREDDCVTAPRKGQIGAANIRFATDDAVRTSHATAVSKFASMFRRLADR